MSDSEASSDCEDFSIRPLRKGLKHLLKEFDEFILASKSLSSKIHSLEKNLKVKTYPTLEFYLTTWKDEGRLTNGGKDVFLTQKEALFFEIPFTPKSPTSIYKLIHK